MKKCTKCNIEKKLEEFSKCKAAKDGLSCQCKSCVKEYGKEYYKSNIEKRREYIKKNEDKIKEQRNRYEKENIEKIKERNKEYRKANADKISKRTKEYRKANAKNIKESRDKYYKANSDKINEQNKIYRESNKELLKEKRKEYDKKYRSKNKDFYKKYHNNRFKHKRETDPLYKLSHNIRVRTNAAFKGCGWTKPANKKMLGCEYENAKTYLESMFLNGMGWDNYGLWHIDHIIPLSSAKCESELIKLCHYSNLQPLWAKDNLSKSDKIIEKQLKLL